MTNRSNPVGHFFLFIFDIYTFFRTFVTIKSNYLTWKRYKRQIFKF